MFYILNLYQKANILIIFLLLTNLVDITSKKSKQIYNSNLKTCSIYNFLFSPKTIEISTIENFIRRSTT